MFWHPFHTGHVANIVEGAKWPCLEEHNVAAGCSQAIRIVWCKSSFLLIIQLYAALSAYFRINNIVHNTICRIWNNESRMSEANDCEKPCGSVNDWFHVVALVNLRDQLCLTWAKGDHYWSSYNWNNNKKFESERNGIRLCLPRTC